MGRSLGLAEGTSVSEVTWAVWALAETDYDILGPVVGWMTWETLHGCGPSSPTDQISHHIDHIRH